MNFGFFDPVSLTQRAFMSKVTDIKTQMTRSNDNNKLQPTAGETLPNKLIDLVGLDKSSLNPLAWCRNSGKTDSNELVVGGNAKGDNLYLRLCVYAASNLVAMDLNTSDPYVEIFFQVISNSI